MKSSHRVHVALSLSFPYYPVDSLIFDDDVDGVEEVAIGQIFTR